MPVLKVTLIVVFGFIVAKTAPLKFSPATVPTGQNVTAAAADDHACCGILAIAGNGDVYIYHGGRDAGDKAAHGSQRAYRPA